MEKWIIEYWIRADKEVPDEKEAQRVAQYMNKDGYKDVKIIHLKEESITLIKA